MMKIKAPLLFLLALGSLLPFTSRAQQDNAAKESKYYQITDVPIPDSIALEVGGLAFTDDDKLGVATRHGEVWVIEDPYGKKLKTPQYTHYASGLHEPLYLAYRNGSFYTTQRSELTKLTDTNQDGIADVYKTIYAWPLSGNYHEYSYGPLFLPNGDMLVNLNLSWIGKGASLAKWRGWMLKITENGEMTPFATGMRSPAGLGFNAQGDIFYAENQGDWIGSGRITHVKMGDFVGNPAGLRWSGEPNSPLQLQPGLFPDSIGLMADFAKTHPDLKLPAVWFPHTIMGISTSAILPIDHDAFGPFKGQLLVGDQGHSKVMRVYLEQVNGEYQGAVFPFREGFASGVLRLAWGSDHSLFVGMTSRGWASTGKAEYGLQRVIYNGKTPLEIKALRALPTGFELEFTLPINKKLAADLKAYQITSFTYSYHKNYGSPIINQMTCTVSKAEVAADGRKVKLSVNGLREGYIHELKVKGLQAQNGDELLHPVAYYSLNAIPGGAQPHHDHAAMMAGARAAKSNDTSPCGPDPAKNITTQPASWTNGPETTITIGTKPGLKFDIENFEVPEGSKVKLVFNNQDDMLHNLVITNKGKGDEVGKKAMDLGVNGSQLGYIPESHDVLYNTCLLQPETSQSIYFVAPKAGEYPYLCSFPGHYFIMKGTMKVVSRPKATN
jgi:uncharacterized cupredoxin-like copper-binding protein/glucose/arabinose dehydrogenase